MTRSFPAAALIATTLACAAAAAPAERLMELKRVFVHLDAYLKTPPAERSRFVVVYRIRKAGGGGLNDVKAWIVDGPRRSPLEIAPDGTIEHLPTLEEWERAKLALSAPTGTKFAVTLDLEPLERPAAEMDAQPLVLAANQATAAVHKAQGPLGLVVPAFDQIYFEGVTSGEEVWPDGRRRPLKVHRGQPVFDTAADKGVQRLRFSRPPMEVQIGPK